MPRPKVEGGKARPWEAPLWNAKKRDTYLNKQKQQQRNAQALSNISQ